MKLAEQNLGVYYALGQSVTNNDSEAAKWYRKAAEQGFAEAQLDLGRCFDSGKGVTKDSAEAAKWYQRSGNNP